jgi:hypothetical protein
MAFLIKSTFITAMGCIFAVLQTCSDVGCGTVTAVLLGRCNVSAQAQQVITTNKEAAKGAENLFMRVRVLHYFASVLQTS